MGTRSSGERRIGHSYQLCVHLQGEHGNLRAPACKGILGHSMFVPNAVEIEWRASEECPER